MICPDCGNDFNLEQDRSDFNSFCEDPTFSYNDLDAFVCYNCARIRFDVLFENAEESDYDDIY